MRPIIFLPSILFFALTAPQSLVSQITERTLERAESGFPEPFSNIAGLRELSDGRIVIADRTERRISIVDFSSGAMADIGRQGQGPGEYATPGGLVGLPNDRTLLVDFGNMRLTQIDADGRFGETWSMMSDEGSFRNVMASDGQGRFYFSQNMIMTPAGSSSLPDSLSILRWDPATGNTEAVASISRSASRGTGGVVMSGGSARMMGMSAFSPRDAWAVDQDGNVAVARAEHYRVDWYRGSDGVLRGPAIEYLAVRVTQDEKEAWAENISGQSASFIAVGGSGGSGGTMQMEAPDIDDVEFPDYKPPFASNAVHMAPDGNLWVGLHQIHNEGRQLFDVIDGRGQVLERIRLPAGRSLVGFGDGVVYAVWADEDDLQWLERYRR